MCTHDVLRSRTVACVQHRCLKWGRHSCSGDLWAAPWVDRDLRWAAAPCSDQLAQRTGPLSLPPRETVAP